MLLQLQRQVTNVDQRIETKTLSRDLVWDFNQSLFRPWELRIVYNYLAAAAARLWRGWSCWWVVWWDWPGPRSAQSDSPEQCLFNKIISSHQFSCVLTLISWDASIRSDCSCCRVPSFLSRWVSSVKSDSLVSSSSLIWNMISQLLIMLNADWSIVIWLVHTCVSSALDLAT